LSYKLEVGERRSLASHYTLTTGITADALRAKSVQNRRFRSNRGRLTKFQVEGVAPTNHSSSQKTRLNDLSYGIKIWTDLSSVLSQCPRLTDGQTAFSSLDRVCIPCSAVKMITASGFLTAQSAPNSFTAGATPLGELTALPRLSSWFKGALFLRGGRVRKEEREEGKGRKEKGVESREGEGTEKVGKGSEGKGREGKQKQPLNSCVRHYARADCQSRIAETTQRRQMVCITVTFSSLPPRKHIHRPPTLSRRASYEADKYVLRRKQHKACTSLLTLLMPGSKIVSSVDPPQLYCGTNRGSSYGSTNRGL